MEHLYNTMELKRHVCPTRLFWGVDSRELLFDALKEVRRVVLVVDQAIAGLPFVTEECRKHLPLSEVVVVDGEPESRSIEAWTTLLPEGVDALVAIGGGSTMDAAKALRAHLAFGQWNIKDRPALPSMPRLVTLPTTPASGSEVSRYYVVTDSATQEKRAYRSWSLCADYAILDPVWTEHLPLELLYASAFDAFTHLWESFICRQERSWLNEAICLEGMSRLIPVVNGMKSRRFPSSEERLTLHYAAALGGMALSNVRTGLLHDSGEALAAQVKLPHPLTMTVFLEEALALYAEAVEERLERLKHTLSFASNGTIASTGTALGQFWMEGFDSFGSMDRVREALNVARPAAEPIIAKILADGVLVKKESPVPLDEHNVRTFVSRSLGRMAGWPSEGGH